MSNLLKKILLGLALSLASAALAWAGDFVTNGGLAQVIGALGLGASIVPLVTAAVGYTIGWLTPELAKLKEKVEGQP